MFISLLALAAATTAPPPVRTRPLRNLASYVQDGDWPRGVASNFRGTTEFSLTIDARGRVTACEIIQSSGSALIDATTCRILRLRARFSPARDAANHPVADTVSNSIGWFGGGG